EGKGKVDRRPGRAWQRLRGVRSAARVRSGGGVVRAGGGAAGLTPIPGHHQISSARRDERGRERHSRPLTSAPGASYLPSWWISSYVFLTRTADIHSVCPATSSRPRRCAAASLPPAPGAA